MYLGKSQHSCVGEIMHIQTWKFGLQFWKSCICVHDQCMHARP